MESIVLIIMGVLLAYALTEVRSISMRYQQERIERNELERDLQRLTELSDNTGQLPVTQPELLTPEAVKCSFNIIRLICICSEGARKEVNQ